MMVVVLAGLLAGMVSLCLAIREDLARHCIHYGPEDCLHLPDADCQTMELPDGRRTLLCCDMLNAFTSVDHINSILSKDKNITALHIRSVSLETLDVAFLNSHSLVSLAITDSSNLKQLKGQLGLDSLVCLNLSNNALTTIEPSMLLTVRTLKYLELSNNNLSRLPDIPETSSTLGLDMYNNNNVLCGHVSEKMAQKDVQFQRQNITRCSTLRDFGWFNLTYRMLLCDLRDVTELETTCPQGTSYKCRCDIKSMAAMKGNPSDQAKDIVEVDCSDQNLTELPDSLPKNTAILNITNNHVTSLTPLVNNPAYRQVRIFIANGNNILSILELEGSNFINNFMKLELRRNNITVLPTYILQHSFDTNSRNELYLGENKLSCDCTAARIVKPWLVAFKERIPDVDEILCESGGKVIDLDHSVTCIAPHSLTIYIHFIIAIEVVLLVILLSKFYYDYRVYTSTGKLPWIASKLPKTPYFWFLEP